MSVFSTPISSRVDRPVVWKVGKLAKIAGASPTTGLNLETNPETRAQRHTVRKLAAALGVEPAELVEG